jgi:hypothetical protein
MNMKNFRKVLVGTITMMVLIAVTSSCRGPRGYDGYDGLNGLDGLDGINYTRTAIYDVVTSDWTGDANGYYANLTVPEITNDIYNNGAILVYRLFEDSPKSFNMLPYTYVDNNTSTYMDYNAYIGKLELTFKVVVSGVNDTPAPDVKMAFKVVVVQGLSLSALKSKVDVKNFDAVVKYLGVKSNATIEFK